ncbi:hypothetical protein [Methyloceanibacter sp.]|uniref:hypothetical protein n=1 Tax=Methyloceanibacter sp. TaxID=1965321 RepID=UPI002D7027CB|nr:hypothetical protein [Methyloceanibacter sp.]HZP10196.1 hypothetical protein [Methyloceanibacter sp.]
MTCKVPMAAAACAALAIAFSVASPVQAGTCQSVRAKGFAGSLAKATLYAQADLKQTAKAMKGKVKSATTNCQKVMGGNYYCKIDAVVCPK